MSEPFIGEIKMVAFDFAPRYWACCDGQSMEIHQNVSLFSLLSTRYGGNGTTHFNLPDMRGRIPVAPGYYSHGAGYYRLGESGGYEMVPLYADNMPAHTHAVTAKAKAYGGSGDQSSPVNNTWAVPGAMGETPYSNSAPNQSMSSGSVEVSVLNAGNGKPHENRPPHLCVNFIIALQGRFPSRN